MVGPKIGKRRITERREGDLLVGCLALSRENPGSANFPRSEGNGSVAVSPSVVPAAGGRAIHGFDPEKRRGSRREGRENKNRELGLLIGR